MKTVVVYSGRFQPPHKGHKASYDHLVERFGAKSVYMSSAPKVPGPEDPFTWEEKKKLAVHAGIPANKFVGIKNGYSESLIHDVIPYNSDDTVLILALSEKDGSRLVSDRVDADGFALKRDGTRQPIQRLGKNPLPVSSGFYYVVETPTVEFPILGQDIHSASQIRDMYATASSKKRDQILIDLYGATSPKLRELFDKRLGVIQTESLLREFLETVNKF